MLNFLLTSRNVGVRSKPPKNSRIGMVSPNNIHLALHHNMWAKHTSDWSTIHDLELRDCFTLVVLIRSGSGCLSADDRKFHVLDLYADEEEVDFSNNNVFEVISAKTVCWLHACMDQA